MTSRNRKFGRLGAVLAVAGFVASPMLLTGCDNTSTSKRTTTTKTETPTSKTTESHTDKVTTENK